MKYAALTLLAVFLVLPACTGGLEDTLARVRAERELVAADLAALEAGLADARDTAPDSPAVAQAAQAVDKAQSVAADLDAVVAAVLARLEARQATDDAVLDNLGAAGDTVATISPYLPPGLDGIAALIGVALTTTVAAVQRRRRIAAETERDTQAEALRDLTRGVDAWVDREVANGGRDEALALRQSIRGKLSERTRPVVARAADHPLASES